METYELTTHMQRFDAKLYVMYNIIVHEAIATFKQHTILVVYR